MADASANRRGIVAIVCSMAFFAANDAACRIAAKWLPVSEIVSLRAFFTLIFAFLIVAVRGESAKIPRIWNAAVLLRALAEAIVGLLLISALALMPFANVIAILMVQPFLLTIAAVFLLKESVGLQIWGAVFIGFIGMLFIVKPATDAFDSASLLALTATLFVLIRDLLTHRIESAVPTTVITFATALVGVFVGGIGVFAEPWRMPELYPFIAVVISAAFLVAAYMLIVIAFRGTDVSSVSPFRYSIVVFAVIYGMVLFAEVPDMLSFIGIFLIASAGLYMLHHETTRWRQKYPSTPKVSARRKPPT